MGGEVKRKRFEVVNDYVSGVQGRRRD